MRLSELEPYVITMLEDTRLDTIEKVGLLENWVEKTENMMGITIQHSSELAQNNECLQYLKNMISELSEPKQTIPYE